MTPLRNTDPTCESLMQDKTVKWFYQINYSNCPPRKAFPSTFLLKISIFPPLTLPRKLPYLKTHFSTIFQNVQFPAQTGGVAVGVGCPITGLGQILVLIAAFECNQWQEALVATFRRRIAYASCDRLKAVVVRILYNASRNTPAVW